MSDDLARHVLDALSSSLPHLVPAVIVPLCLYLVHRHPQPVDDCPCFEDALAFVSVVMGEMVARWYMVHNGYDEDFFTRPMPGGSWATWSDIGTWWSTAAIKMVIGTSPPLHLNPDINLSVTPNDTPNR